MTDAPNYVLEALRGLLTISGWYILFYRCHTPPGKRRRILVLALFPVCYILFMLIPLTSLGNSILWAALILLFALLCCDVRASGILDPLFTALYYIGMEACMDTLDGFIVRHHLGHWFSAYSLGYYINYNLQYLVMLGWALFYAWALKKNRREKLPLRFWIMTVIPPLGSAALLTLFAETARPLQRDQGINIYAVGIQIGLFLVVLNMATFYRYLRLLTYYESHEQAEVLQGQIDAYARRITVIEAFQRQTGEMRHDLKNILFTLNIDMDQRNYEGVNRRIASLLEHLKQAEPERYTGIALIDAVLSYKAAQMRELGSAFSVQADLLDLEPPIAHDIASLMEIALDNAMDTAALSACGESPTSQGESHACQGESYSDQVGSNAGKEKSNADQGGSNAYQEGSHTDHVGTPVGQGVHCLIQKQKNRLLIQLTNPIPSPLCCKTGEIQSTKTEGASGLGLPALRRIVRTYSGEVSISDSGGVFSLSATLLV